MGWVTYTFGLAVTGVKMMTVIVTVTQPQCGPFPLTRPLMTVRMPIMMSLAHRLWHPPSATEQRIQIRAL